MKQEICVGCQSRFFADEEEDVIEGNFYCSFCLPRVIKCLMCDKIVVMNKDATNFEGLCSHCKQVYMGFTNIWLIRRFKTFQRDNFTCRYCGRTPRKDLFVELNCDHIVPRAKGGNDKPENLITSCKECNLGKLDILLSEGQQALLKQRKTIH